MGCCYGCLKKQHKYEKIQKDGKPSDGKPSATEVSKQMTPSALKNDFYQEGKDNGFGEAKISGNVDLLDQTSPVLQGSLILQKFANNSTYQSRFVWIDLPSKTIHMSEHTNKDRRHKEATLLDVTSVDPGLPTKRKKKPSASSGLINMDEEASRCMTINFLKGGSVDLKFQDKKERDLWLNTFNEVIKKYGLTST